MSLLHFVWSGTVIAVTAIIAVAWVTVKRIEFGPPVDEEEEE